MEGWAGSPFRASSGCILSRWPRKVPQQRCCYVIPPQKSQGYPLALPLHNPSRMQWTQEAKISLPQQCAAVPARALCQATSCAVLNPSYIYSISCNYQRFIRCLTLIVAVWWCLFKSCTMRAEVNNCLHHIVVKTSAIPPQPTCTLTHWSFFK